MATATISENLAEDPLTNNNSTTTNSNTNSVVVVVTDDDKEQEQLEASAARALRLELDDLLESFGNYTTEDSFEDVTAQLMQEEFMVLVSQYSDESMRRAVVMTSHGPESHRYTGRLPIHLACDKNAPIQVIQYLLDSDIQKISVPKTDKWGDLPLHTACSRQNPQVVKLLLDCDSTKQTLLVKDNHDYLPLHMACRYQAQPQVIQWLLESDQDRTSLYQEGVYGQLPIHVACRCNAPPEIIQLLIDYDVDKTTVLKEDSAGRLPIHVGLMRITNLNTIQMVLEAMFCGRMERMGLELWKRDVSRFLKSMSTYERDFNTRDKLDQIAEKFHVMKEKIHVLELALWKATCLKSCGIKSMEELVELAQKDESFDPAKYKQNCRIKSGAEEVIKHVLPFVEDEPITQLIQDFRSQ